MTKQTIAQILILTTAVTWIVFDIIVYIAYGNASTISARVWYWSWHIPGIPFAVGVLIGHLFFQMHEPTAFPDEEKK